MSLGNPEKISVIFMNLIKIINYFGDVILMNPLKYLWYVFPACLRNTGGLSFVYNYTHVCFVCTQLFA